MNFTYTYGLGVWKEQIYKDDFDSSRKNVFSAETDVSFYII